MDITYTHSISTEDYNYLRELVGFRSIHPEKAKLGLEHTSFLTVALHNGAPIGMARVISDYGYVAYIADVIVSPEYQGQGIGNQLMTNVMDYIKSTLTEGHSIMINLMAATEKEPFYEKFGFQKRPNEEAGCGMSQWVKEEIL